MIQLIQQTHVLLFTPNLLLVVQHAGFQESVWFTPSNLLFVVSLHIKRLSFIFSWRTLRSKNLQCSSAHSQERAFCV